MDRAAVIDLCQRLGLVPGSPVGRVAVRLVDAGWAPPEQPGGLWTDTDGRPATMRQADEIEARREGRAER